MARATTINSPGDETSNDVSTRSNEDVRIRKDLGAYCPIVENEFIGQLHGTTSTDISIWNIYDDNGLRTSDERNDCCRRDIVRVIIRLLIIFIKYYTTLLQYLYKI